MTSLFFEPLPPSQSWPRSAHEQHRSRHLGFTLLEVLVSLLLLSLLSLVSWRALDGVQRGSERLDSALNDTQAIARVLGQLADDIDNHAGSHVLLQPVTRTRGRRQNITLLPPGLQVTQDRKHETALALVRASSFQNGNWQRVVWQQEGSTLQRAVGQSDITLPLPVPDDKTMVLNDIDDFTLRLWLPGTGWLSLADAGRLPAKDMRQATGLEIVISRRQSEHVSTYRKVVPLQTRG